MSATVIRPSARRGWLRWLRRDPRATLSLTWLVALIVLGLLAPVIAPFSPTAQNVNDMLLPPDATHWLARTTLAAMCSAGCSTVRPWLCTPASWRLSLQ